MNANLTNAQESYLDACEACSAKDTQLKELSPKFRAEKRANSVLSAKYEEKDEEKEEVYNNLAAQYNELIMISIEGRNNFTSRV